MEDFTTAAAGVLSGIARPHERSSARLVPNDFRSAMIR